ncbi:MAG: sigma-70 family RNA polymerase sigma factor [Bacteroidetes bacterium]|nr:sigma-70 family RNA polymerase sigma factor [Bacteroidota bacterium]
MSYATSHQSHLTDNELVKHYKMSSDKIYVGELYKRYTHLVLGMCINYFKDKDVAKDVVLQIFEKLFEELKKREVENFKAWLTFVVRNHCISELRKMQTQLNRDVEYQYQVKVNAIEEDEELEAEEEQKLEALEKALESLNPFQKKCIELFYLKNMTYTQIVEMTGYSVNEVKSYIQNGKRNLKMIITNTK